MYFHIILTERCNSRCKYCYQKSEKDFENSLSKKFEFDFSAPPDLEIDIETLKKFISKDKNPKIIFYGGEPLMRTDLIKQIMDKIPNSGFYIQTNGKMLNMLPDNYVKKFSKILVSIDGDEKITDFNRGYGTYGLVIKNIKQIRKYFNGEIVARMTLSFSENSADLSQQVKHLLESGFDSVHWQLDMGFYEYDYNEKRVEEFITKYKEEISKLIEWWIQEIKKGNVPKVYPFVGIFESLYYKKKTKLRCGSGYENYTITTNGTITACPITNCIKNFYVGKIDYSDPNNLKKFKITKPCTSCDYLELCGGRCLYSNYAKLWPEKGQKQICETIKHLIDELKKRIPEIKILIKEKRVNESQFEYEKYFGPEIIP